MTKIDYALARAAAKQLEDLGSSVGDLVKGAKKTGQGVPEYWQGLAAQAFSAALGKWQTDTAKISGELETLGRLIRQTANDFEAQEAKYAAKAAANAVTAAASGAAGGAAAIAAKAAASPSSAAGGLLGGALAALSNQGKGGK